MGGDACKKLAWLSRHPPTKAQRRQLERAGYRIRVSHPPDRFHNGGDMWALAQTACDGVPAVILAIAPKGLLGTLIQRANEFGVPVIQPVNVYDDDHTCEWTGRWRRLITISEDWKP